VSIGALYAAVVAISFEISAPHWVHVLIGALGTLLAAVAIHPQEGAHGGEVPPGVPIVGGVPQSARTPDSQV
jgi:hypothetical protein